MEHTDLLLKIHIVPNEAGNPPGKLADVELHFLPGTMLAGTKLIGFAVWERRRANATTDAERQRGDKHPGRNVTFPARQYSVNGDKRSFALLRPIADALPTDVVRDTILDAYATWEQTVLDETVRTVQR